MSEDAHDKPGKLLPAVYTGDALKAAAINKSFRARLRLCDAPDFNTQLWGDAHPIPWPEKTGDSE